jgi:hypothetical protein
MGLEKPTLVPMPDWQKTGSIARPPGFYSIDRAKFLLSGRSPLGRSSAGQ